MSPTPDNSSLDVSKLQSTATPRSKLQISRFLCLLNNSYGSKFSKIFDVLISTDNTSFRATRVDVNQTKCLEIRYYYRESSDSSHMRR